MVAIMNKNTKYLICALTISILPLSGCGNVRNSLGLDKVSPDEFSVITRAPLEMPNNTALPPPMLGASRPQEQATIAKAKEAVFGKEQNGSNTSSSVENILLQKAGAQEIQPNIRQTITKETAELHDRNKPVAEKLLNISGNNNQGSATIVDAKKELERINNNKAAGKNIIDGKTPVIEE